jgi:hypothetical protein
MLAREHSTTIPQCHVGWEYYLNYSVPFEGYHTKHFAGSSVPAATCMDPVVLNRSSIQSMNALPSPTTSFCYVIQDYYYDIALDLMALTNRLSAEYKRTIDATGPKAVTYQHSDTVQQLAHQL